ncbi:Glycosyltransferase family 17 protein [Rhodotorula toruloides ATCC 204091]|uniref:BY PROTMAP: gi/342320497/gb/EGU12437.1/ Glycosyltransferase family 17 protein [Rhodotorula glutinis ATCC 204091] n=1 Tax=Rhodotorula toruloides TaxID=5286 RepID=A0A0K3CHL0_RHOTO|nr:Glycosyltransferase family 17 protein [Rhodotorula toruloides ATCC 204091]
MLPLSRNRPATLVLALFGGALLIYLVVLRPLLPRGAIAYATRPLWDHDERPSEVLEHYWAEGLDAADQCRLHGWEKRTDKPEMWDATIFSTELDLLLVRLHELSPAVDRFFLVESDRTFTGLPKPLVLQPALANDARFKPFLPRITYRTFKGRALEKGESPWDQEIALRQSMTSLLREHFPPTPTPSPVMLFSDVDELISRRTVSLLKACAFGPPLHLGLRSFVYSFEFEEGGEVSSWRPSAVEWPLRGEGEDEFYRWCFRHLSDFIRKATGYSHVDRLGSRPSALLRPARIQETVCKGVDMFEMLPEAYSYRDFFNKIRLVPSKSAVDIPSYVVEHADELRYLLPGPGNCIREDAPKS